MKTIKKLKSKVNPVIIRLISMEMFGHIKNGYTWTSISKSYNFSNRNK